MSRQFDTDAQQNLAYDIEDAVESGSSIIVTSPGGQEQVVVMCADNMGEWQGLLDLLNDPVTAERLVQAVRAAQAGQSAEQDANPTPPAIQH